MQVWDWLIAFKVAGRNLQGRVYSLVGQVKEDGLFRIVRCQDVYCLLSIHDGGIDAIVLLPGSFFPLMKIVPTHSWAVTFVMAVVVAATQQRAKEGIKATLRRHTATLIEAKVPLSHHMSRVPSVLQFLRKGDVLQREAIRLSGSDDGMLEASVDLISKT